MGKFKKVFPYLLLFLIIGAFFFFRFYNIFNRLFFDWDQETLAFQMKKILVDHSPILIGHRATDAMGFYFGPFFEYFFVPFYALSKLHPMGVVPLLILVNICFVFASYTILKRVINHTIAVAFLIFWCFNPWLIGYDITVWAPLVIPLGYMLTIYLLWRIYQKLSYKNFALLGIVLGFFTQIHSLFFFMDLFAALFVLFLVVAKKTSIIHVLKMGLITMVTWATFFTPLALFDIRHDFLNAKLFLGYFSHRIAGQPKIIESLQVFAQFFKPIIFLSTPVTGLIFLFLGLCLFVYLAKKRAGFLRYFYTTTIVLWLLTILLIFRLTQRPSEYYFMYLYIPLIIGILDFLYRVHRYALVGYCALFIIMNSFTIPSLLQNSVRGMKTKEVIAQEIKKHVGTRHYSLSYSMPRGLNNGYEYFLEYNNIRPSGNEQDPLIILRIPSAKNDIVIDTVGIRIPPEFK